MKAIICIYSVVISLFLLTGCKDTEYLKTAGGMPYKLYKSKGGKKIVSGNFLKISATTMIGDSILYTTKEKLPFYQFVSPNSNPYDISELWTSLHLGDSVVATQLVDTFINRNPASVPPSFKKGDQILTYIKILEVFESDSARMVDQAMENKKWQEQEVTVVTKHLEEKNIKAQKTPGGAFVEIINPGEGSLIDSGNYVYVKYTGVSFSGVTFDSNIDSSFGHTEPLTFVVGTASMIKGFDEAMKFLKKGAVANIYIPSMLAYGPSPQSPKIKPFEHIQFNVTITDVKDKAPLQPEPK